jgi:hypothetical protein
VAACITSNASALSGFSSLIGLFLTGGLIVDAQSCVNIAHIAFIASNSSALNTFESLIGLFLTGGLVDQQPCIKAVHFVLWIIAAIREIQLLKARLTGCLFGVICRG